MNIAWLLENTGIAGSTRAVLALSDAAIARGHRVSIVTTGMPLTWRHSAAEWVYADDFGAIEADATDVVIATSRSTAEAAARVAPGRCAWYCFENDVPEGPSSIPLLAPSHALQQAPTMTYIGAAVDDDVYRHGAEREHDPPRVLLCGPAHEEQRGIDDGYRAVAHARWFHQNVELVRVSPFAPSREEPLDGVQEFHVALSAAEMTRLLHSCDVALFPNHGETVFSLFGMEALAAGLPTILTSIPLFRSFDAQNDYALFAPDDNAVELGDRLIEMLEDADLRARLRARAREVAKQWHAADVAGRLELFLQQRMK